MPKLNKRFEVHDSLGYLSAYKTRRRAEQAIKDMGRAIYNELYYIKDRLDTKAKTIMKKEI